MKLGNIESAIYYCKALIKGDIILRNIKKAKKILEKEIKEKDLSSFYLLNGKIHKIENSYEESKICFEKSFSLGNVESIYEYGKLLFKSNNEQGIQYFLHAINNGCLQAMLKYGVILYDGRIDIEEGIKYIKMAADKGHPKACFIYQRISCSNDLSIHYLKEAVYKGVVGAMYQYGEEIVDSNKNEAMLLFKKVYI